MHCSIFVFCFVILSFDLPTASAVSRFLFWLSHNSITLLSTSLIKKEEKKCHINPLFLCISFYTVALNLVFLHKAKYLIYMSQCLLNFLEGKNIFLNVKNALLKALLIENNYYSLYPNDGN